MASSAPLVDARSAVDIAKQVRDLLKVYAPDWKEQYQDQTDRLGTALIEIFSRFAEIILQRLNQVPEKNLLAFLDLLGESRLPPQPARAPLSFSLAPNSTVDAVVPVGTQVAAPPAEGEKAPVIFETEHELVVTAAQLVSLFTREPDLDRYADYRDWLSTPAAEIPVFQGNHSIEHSLYLGHDALLAYPNIRQLRLEVDLKTNLPEPAPRAVQWEIWDGGRGKPLTPASDTTAALTKSGIVEFAFDGSSQAPFPVVSEQTVDSQPGRWLRCRLSTPIVPNLQLPLLNQVRLGITLQNNNLAIDSAFTNGVAVELSKDFYPFGEKPKSGDTLFLAQGEVFSKVGAAVTLSVVCTNPHYLTAAGRAVAPVNPSGDLQLAWECWDGSRWVELGTSRTPPWVTLIELQPLPETTMNSTVVVEGTVRPGAGVTVTGAQLEGAIYLGEDGRLAARVVLPDRQLSIISFKATFQGHTATAWAITDRRPEPRKIVLTQVPPEETAADRIEIRGQVSGAGKVLVSSDALTEPRVADYSDPNFKVIVPLVEGHNALLIQANNPDGAAVAAMTLAVARRAAPPATVNGFSDGTWCFCQSGMVSFSLPASVAATPINGQQSYWVRVRLRGGDYGREAVYRLKDPTQPEQGYTLTAATFRPPLLARIRADYTQIRLEKPQYCRTLNDFVYTDVTAVNAAGTVSYAPFRPTQDLRPTCYFGFTLPTGRTDFPNRNLSLYLRTAAVKYAATGTAVTPTDEQPRLVWQYHNGTGWTDLTVQDGSENLTRTGLLEWLAPADSAARTEFGQSRYWLRVRWNSGAYRLPPRLSRLLFNTTPAIQAITVRNEILGSSDGSENQRFRATHVPLLSGQQLQVREPEEPSTEEKKVIQQAVGEDAISIVRDAAGRPLEIWIRWQQVSDFYGSRPRDRHYVLDALSGEIRFGNGRNGLIPPIGAGNIRLAYYRTGGGLVGNRPANTIVQLKTTVPYVDKVTNPEPAEGGAEAESLESLLQRAPRTLRHHHQAVSVEDYEDLALLATPAVARAKCVPLYDLVNDPDTKQPKQPGTISLIVVPRTAEPKPVPSLELLDEVSRYLDERRIPTANLVIVGPDYVRVDVTVEIALVSLEGASGVEREVSQTLSRFLHPLTGGLDGKGWDFGREPYLSDLYALLEAVPGVDHIRSLHKQEIEERKDALATGRFLVYSGTHTISLTFAET